MRCALLVERAALEEAPGASSRRGDDVGLQPAIPARRATRTVTTAARG
jgi:hypothetical protein